jgi:hypothetical protein
MPRDRLRSTLQALHAELEAADSLDAEARDRLRSAAREIEQALDADAPESASSLGDRLLEATRHFEATHPTVAAAVGRVIDALAALGI